MISRFRWVECQITTLKDCWTKGDITLALKDLPIGLDATYDRILDKIKLKKARARIKLVLQLVAVAMEPLRLDDVVEALAVDCKSAIIDPDARIHDPSVNLKQCSNLLELHDDMGLVDGEQSDSFVQLGGKSEYIYISCDLPLTIEKRSDFHISP
jgi:hypothetical protein